MYSKIIQVAYGRAGIQIQAGRIHHPYSSQPHSAASLKHKDCVRPEYCEMFRILANHKKTQSGHLPITCCLAVSDAKSSSHLFIGISLKSSFLRT